MAAIATAASAGTLAIFPGASATHGYDHGAHWPRTAGEWPAHVTFVDYTGAAWPVGRASTDWDVPNNLDVDYLAAGSGTCSHHCTPVRAVNPANDAFLTDGCTNTAGQVYGYFQATFDSAAHFSDSGDRVVLNSDCAVRSETVRRALVCQELGHATGLTHAAVTSSCMYQNPFTAATAPRQHDYDVIQAVYNH